jgi:hypothetical protein
VSRRGVGLETVGVAVWLVVLLSRGWQHVRAGRQRGVVRMLVEQLVVVLVVLMVLVARVKVQRVRGIWASPPA